MKLAAREKVLVIGGFRRGKTTRIKRIIRRAPAVIAWDTASEFGAADGFTTCTLDRVVELVKRGVRRIAVRVPPGQVATKLFDEWCRLAFGLRGWVKVIDELSKVIQNPGPSEMNRYPWFSTLWREDHKHGGAILLATHRLSEVPVLLREVHHLLQFGCRARVDLDAIRREYGDAAAAAVENMPPFHYLYVGTDQVPRVAPPEPERSSGASNGTDSRNTSTAAVDGYGSSQGTPGGKT